MKLAFLHLSDIHFENDADWIVKKETEIAGACISSIFNEPIDAFFVIVSGDIANKGSVAQYKIAENFFTKIREKILSEREIPVNIIFVPGNHDCDLSDPANLELRSLSIDKVLKNQDEIKLGSQVYTECLKVQENFFEFINIVEPSLNYPNKPEVFYRLVIPVNGKSIVFNCFNTAWLTKIRKSKGNLQCPANFF